MSTEVFSYRFTPIKTTGEPRKNYFMLALYVGGIWSDFNVIHWTTSAGVAQALPGDTGWPAVCAAWKLKAERVVDNLSKNLKREFHCEWGDPNYDGDELFLLMCDGTVGIGVNLGIDWQTTWTTGDERQLGDAIFDVERHPDHATEVCDRCSMAALVAKMEARKTESTESTAP